MFIYFLSLSIIMLSCSIERPKGKTEAEVLFKEAQGLIEDNRYILATEKLNSLKSQYPYSYYSTFAELMLADILFKQENFEEAAAAYILFKDFHPKHKKTDYVMWKIAESYFNQIPSTFDRDLTPAVRAIKYYNELKSLYPGSKFLKDADLKMKESSKMLLDKELYIANFYFKTKDYDSAKFRFSGILKEIDYLPMRLIALEKLLLIGQITNDKKLCSKFYKKYIRSTKKGNTALIEKAYTACVQ